MTSYLGRGNGNDKGPLPKGYARSPEAAGFWFGLSFEDKSHCASTEESEDPAGRISYDAGG